MQGDQERTLSNGFEDFSLGSRVFRRLFLLDNRRLFEDFHGVEAALVEAGSFLAKEDFAVGSGPENFE